ncbi:MAG: CBS domain-containing protein [Chloroflexota bacterium]
MVTRHDLQDLLQDHPADDGAQRLADVVSRNPVVAYPDQLLRAVMDRMAETGLTRFPVVDREDPRKLLGMIALTDILKARMRSIDGERHREQVLRLHILFPLRGQRVKETGTVLVDETHDKV